MFVQLQVKHNKLRTINTCSFDDVLAVGEIWLTGNPLHCDCAVAWTSRAANNNAVPACNLIFRDVLLSTRGQPSLEAKIFGLILVLGLMQCWPRSHERCPHGLVVSHRNHVIYVTFFSAL